MTNFNPKKIFFCILFIVASFNLFAKDIITDEESAKGYQAILDCDFSAAMDIALPIAQEGEPEAQFSVGLISILWIDSECAKEPPRFTLSEAISWMRKSADQGVIQAAEFFRGAYERGDYGFPISIEMASCWSAVENGEHCAAICRKLEEEAGIK